MFQTQLAALTQEQYVEALMLQKDIGKRNRMKQWAHGVMYGRSLEAKVYIPANLIPDTFQWK